MKTFTSTFTATFTSLAVLAAMVASSALAAEGLTHNEYVTLSGTVGKVISADEFELNYGSGTIKVDTNDTWPEMFTRHKDRGNLPLIKPGDNVTVSGRVDKNWLTANEIEAEMVTIATGNMTTTFRNPRNTGNIIQRNIGYFSKGGQMSLSGTVTEVKNDHEFILQYGSGNTIQVDTDTLSIPNDQRIAVGERVTVYGTFDKGLTERNEIQAEAIDRSDHYTRATNR